MKIANWLLALYFFLSAALQYNDPDPLPWMALYGGIALLFAWAALGRRLPRWTAWLALAASVLWAAALLPDFIRWVRLGMPSIVGTMKAENPWVELTREFLGLVLAAAGAGFLVWQGREKGERREVRGES
jgi:MFS superfamily sulfate permease-like transporter